MLKAIIIAPDKKLGRDVQQLCIDIGDLSVLRVYDSFPHPADCNRLLNLHSPDVILLQIPNRENSATVQSIADMAGLRTGTTLIGFRGEGEVSETPHWMEHVLTLPASSEDLRILLGVAVERSKSGTSPVFAFLPAKAGSGATTTALHVANSFRGMGQSVLILETDVHSGPLSFYLQLTPAASITEALDNSHKMTEELWRQLINSAHGLDLLLASQAGRVTRTSLWNYHRILRFARSRYDVVVVDLPEVVNDATEAIITQATKVCIVCTTERASVALARKRVLELEARGCKDSAIEVILNRNICSAPADREHIQQALHRPIYSGIRNDYLAVTDASNHGALVDPLSEIGHEYANLARQLSGMAPSPARERAEKKSSFYRFLRWSSPQGVR